jgi:hypothetical protein
MLTAENFRFARQAGATHIVAHIIEGFGSLDNLSTASGSAAMVNAASVAGV